MSGDAGTRMPEYQINIYHCGTTFSGWLNGKHPTENGLIVDRQVCFTKSVNFKTPFGKNHLDQNSNEKI